MQKLKSVLKKEENWTQDRISWLITVKNQTVHAAFSSLNPNLEKEYDNTVDMVWKVGHYRMIEEFRKRLKLDKKLINSFRVYLADATRFYLFWVKAWGIAYNLVRVNEIVVSRLDVYDSDSYDSEFSLAPMTLSPALQEKVSKTVHRSLIYLGDLARYRELHVPMNGKRDKRWSLAKNFYTLAIWLLPENGNPYNQLAVIESYEGNELGALDYYFKSLSVKIPFSTGFDNVVVLLKKIAARDGLKDLSVQGTLSQYLILLHSSLLVDKSIDNFLQVKMLFLKELYQELSRGNMINSRYLKSIWSHSALQSLAGQDGKARQLVLWALSVEIMEMILKFVIEGQKRLDLYFNALKLYIRFLFSHMDEDLVIQSFKENIRPLILVFYNKFCSEYSSIFQEPINLELVREDVENIGWLLFANDPTASFWTLDKLNENTIEEKRVRVTQILFLGLQFDMFPKLGMAILKNKEIPRFVLSKTEEQENVTPVSMLEDVHPVLNSILQKMDEESEDQEILVYKGRKKEPNVPNSPSNFWSSSFKSDSLVKNLKSYVGAPMSGNVKNYANNDMMIQDLPSDGVNTMSFLGLVSSPMGARQNRAFTTPGGTGNVRQIFSMPPLQQTPTDFFGTPMGISSADRPPSNMQLSDKSGFSIPPPPGFTRFGQPQHPPSSSNTLESPWSKQIASSPLVNHEILPSPGPMPPMVGMGSFSNPPINSPVSPWLNAGAHGGMTGNTMANTGNIFHLTHHPSESSPAWFNQTQNQHNPNESHERPKVFNPPPQSFTHW